MERASPTALHREALVVAYEADEGFDRERRCGWSVAVTGRAETVTDPAEVTQFEHLLHPWVNHADTVLAISADVVQSFASPPSRDDRYVRGVSVGLAASEPPLTVCRIRAPRRRPCRASRFRPAEPIPRTAARVAPIDR